MAFGGRSDEGDRQRLAELVNLVEEFRWVWDVKLTRLLVDQHWTHFPKEVYYILYVLHLSLPLPPPPLPPPPIFLFPLFLLSLFLLSLFLLYLLASPPNPPALPPPPSFSSSISIFPFPSSPSSSTCNVQLIQYIIMGVPA